MPIIQFKGKTAIESYYRVVPHHTLEIDSKLSPAKKPGLDGNLIIEGDNLIALKGLLPTHAGRIKCIYIDPPYNTGNEGWVVQSGGGAPLYQLKITLRWSKPPIWRRLVVGSDMKLDRLHRVIQVAMGWTNSHMHHFIAGKKYYGQPNPELAGHPSETLDERRCSVAQLAPAARKKFIYEYDFGDSWEHEVVVEKVLSPKPGFGLRRVWRGRTTVRRKTAAASAVTMNCWKRCETRKIRSTKR